MRRIHSFFLISAISIGIFIFLVISGVVSAYLMANRGTVRFFLTVKARQVFNSDLDYAQLSLHFLPVPHLEAHDLRISRPDRFDFKARKLSLYPAFLPILSGRFHIRHLILAEPDIQLRSSPVHLSSEDRTNRSVDAVSGKSEESDPIVDLFNFLDSIDPETTFQIQNGRIRLLSENAVMAQVEAVNAVFSHMRTQLSLKINGTTPFTGPFHIEAVSPADVSRIRGEITASTMDMEAILGHVPVPDEFQIQGDSGPVRLKVAVNRDETAMAQFSLIIPVLTVTHNNHVLPIHNTTISGFIGYLKEQWMVSIDTLNTRKPALSLSGEVVFRTATDTGPQSLEIRATTQMLDISTVGAIARTVSADSPDVDTAFSIVRSGVLTDLSFMARFEHTPHAAASDWTLATLSSTAHLEQGKITIPDIEADLTELEGHVAYADTQVTFHQMRGAFQGIRFSNLSAAIDWTNDAVLSIETPSAEVDMAVFFPWLTGLEGLSAARLYLSDVSGKADLSLIEINGPLIDPEKWRYAASATPNTIHVKTPHAPFPIILDGGKIIYRPGVEQSSQVGVRFLDADVTVSHESRGMVPPETVSCRIDGILGAAAAEWLADRLPVPASLAIRAPITLSGTNLRWDGNNAVEFSGNLKTADAMDLYGKVHFTPDAWQMEKLIFSDPDSNAVMSATWREETLSLTFSGTIDAKTVDRLLRRNDFFSGSVSGRFTTHIHMDRPFFSIFAGTLSGKGLHLKGSQPVPMDINRFSLSGSGSRVTISDSEVRIHETLLQVSGDVFHRNATPGFDLLISTEKLDMDAFQVFLNSEKSGETDLEKGKTPDLLSSARGTIHLTANQVQAKGFAISPVDAVMTVDSTDIHAHVKQATICGITAIGTMQSTPSGLSIDLGLSAKNMEMKETLACLPDVRLVVDGRYQLSGHLSMTPTKTDYLNAMTGNVSLTSDNGRILHDHVLMTVLSILNITELFTGGESDLNQQGYGYHHARANAVLSKGQIQLVDMILDSNALKVTCQGSVDLSAGTADMYLLAAPMKTLDRIVRNIPGLNYLSGGSLVAIPLRVHGPVTDLSVVPLSPSAVGKSLLNIMQRVLHAPFRLVAYMKNPGVSDAPQIPR